MCAIFGLGFMHGHKVENSSMVREIVRGLFVENQARGTHASGLAFVNSRQIHVVKKDVRGETLITLPEYKDAERRYMTFSTADGATVGEVCKAPPIAFIGHCRFQTKGTYRVNENNHPIVRDQVVGVHNGSIGNDDKLFGLYSKTFKRNAEVDSEIIFALIEYFSKDAQKSTAKAIQKASKAMTGGFACAMSHRFQPYIVWLFRRNNPCDVVIYRKVGMVAWSSSNRYIEEATKNYREFLGPGEIVEFNQNSGMGIDLYRNFIQRFELEGYTYNTNALSVG